MLFDNHLLGLPEKFPKIHQVPSLFLLQNQSWCLIKFVCYIN